MIWISLVTHFLLLPLLTRGVIFQIDEELPNNTEIAGVSNYMDELRKRECTKVDCKHFYKLFKQNEKFVNLLNLNNKSGILETRGRIDYEELCQNRQTCLFDVNFLFITDMATKRFTFSIKLNDINDNSPKWDMLKTQNNDFVIDVSFDEDFNSDQVKLGKEQRTSLPIAQDLDSGDNGRISYQLQSSNLENDEYNEDHFKLEYDQIDGKLWLIPQITLDAEVRAHYEYYLIAKDHGLPERKNKVLLKININDINDESPRFSKSIYYPEELGNQISESITPGSVVLQVSAVDRDKTAVNNQITYESLTKETDEIHKLFLIQPNGQIIITKNIDFEMMKSQNYDLARDTEEKAFTFLIRATDNGEYPMKRSATATVIIPVKDENDTPPQMSVNFFIKTENRGQNNIVGKVIENTKEPLQIAYIHVRDPDLSGQDEIKCQVSDEKRFSLSLVSTEKTEKKVKEADFILSLMEPIDREQKNSLRLKIECIDLAENRAKEVILIEVSDENDNVPTFKSNHYNFEVAENIEPSTINSESFNGYYIGKVEAYDRDQGNNSMITYELVENLTFKQVNYSLINDLMPSLETSGVNGDIENLKTSDYFVINPHTGLIYAKQSFDAEIFERFNFQVKATDSPIDLAQQKSSLANVTVNIGDLNDQVPIFTMRSAENSSSKQLVTTGNNYIFTVFENETIGANIGLVSSVDLDRSELSEDVFDLFKQRISYRMSQDSQPLSRSTFKINSLNGMITLTKRLDRESQAMYTFNVIAIDRQIGRSGVTQSATAVVTILVEDINDNDPEFVKPVQSWQFFDQDSNPIQTNNIQMSSNQIPTIVIPKANWIAEEDSHDSNVHRKLFTVKGRDIDFGLNSELNYSIETGNPDDRYFLDKYTGDFYLINYKAIINGKNSPTYLDGSSSIYNLIEFRLCDKGEPIRCSQKMIVQLLFELNEKTNDATLLEKAQRLSYQNGANTKIGTISNNFLVNEAVMICIAIIFSILVLVTIILIYLIRNRATIISRHFRGKHLGGDKSGEIPNAYGQSCEYSISNINQENEIFLYTTNKSQDAEPKILQVTTIPNELYDLNHQFGNMTLPHAPGSKCKATRDIIFTPKLGKAIPIKNTTHLTLQSRMPQSNNNSTILNNSINESAYTYHQLNTMNQRQFVDGRKIHNYPHPNESYEDEDEIRKELETTLLNQRSSNNSLHGNTEARAAHVSAKYLSDAYKEASFV